MSATLSRWSRALVASGVCWLVVWQAAAVAGLPRRTTVALGLYGFVLSVVFGKAYSLVPSYFDRALAWEGAPAVHLPLAVLGTTGLALAPLAQVPAVVEAAGATAWAAGAAVFLATLARTLRDNLAGAETGTGDHNADRRPVDRAANLFVPVVFAYLAVGSWETLAVRVTALPTLLDGYPPRATHLLAAGGAALLLFAVGFRLLPRFLVTDLPAWAPWAVLPPGALGPVLLAAGLSAGPVFRAGAVLEAVAVVGFAVTYVGLYRASDRDRVGFHGPLLGVGFGLLAVALGLSFAFGAVDPALVAAHYRLNLLGFLGLSILGVTFQFYPPTVGRFPGAGDDLALASMGLIAGGLGLELLGVAVPVALAPTAGRALALAGAVAYAYLVLGVFVQRARA
ncbi:hypothetical protein C475_16206 [Halosimplex carlsbadense 2-9-1]|uniref:Uncharacterized protein n=1 Tax=Halosimplex carlsbadense 2-9-1 TaxID=797114 RepID=M0CHE2_9EURY|nr:hypothetical protein [Halosimplex carlsbadense]ELZ22661.1 hypothetical protein C475_16206 [Halosimplex carlsbadense 2-9-1]